MRVCTRVCSCSYTWMRVRLCTFVHGRMGRAVTSTCVCVCVCVCVFGVGNMAISEAPPCPGDQVWLPPPAPTGALRDLLRTAPPWGEDPRPQGS